MSCPFNGEQLAQLKIFVQLCKSTPLIIHHPALSFFKDFLISLGATIPAATFETKNSTPAGDSKPHNATPPDDKISSEDKASAEELDTESDVELDLEGVIEPDQIDNTEDYEYPEKEITDEDIDKSDEKRSEAMKAFSEQKYDDAIKLYTEAIELNPQSALCFVKRGQTYLKLNKPNACIRDCNIALKINADSAVAYKFRGRAHRLLGSFENAYYDLCESLKIDYDDQTNEWLTEVKPNAEKLRQHKLRTQRKKEEKEYCARKVQGANKPANKPANNMPDFAQMLFNPEIAALLEDPEIGIALQRIANKPSCFVEYQDNPKIMAALKLFESKLGFRDSSAPDGMKPSKAPTDDDVGLD